MAYKSSSPPASAPNSFVALLHELAAGPDAVEIIRFGLQAAVLSDAAAYFAVPLQRVCSVVRLPETAAHTLSKRGQRLGAAVSERIWRLAHVMQMATDVFEDEDAAKAWLRSPNRSFPCGTPMEYLDTEPGAAVVRQVLSAIATGAVL